jgi:hypothetical protein
MEATLNDDGSRQLRRKGKKGFPSIDTINRRAAGRTDVRKKIRYFRKLLLELDGEIGNRLQTFQELMNAGELSDPEVPRLEIE